MDNKQMRFFGQWNNQEKPNEKRKNFYWEVNWMSKERDLIDDISAG